MVFLLGFLIKFSNQKNIQNDKHQKNHIVNLDKLICDLLPSSLMDSNVSLNWKQQKNKELEHAP